MAGPPLKWAQAIMKARDWASISSHIITAELNQIIPKLLITKKNKAALTLVLRILCSSDIQRKTIKRKMVKLTPPKLIEQISTINNAVINFVFIHEIAVTHMINRLNCFFLIKKQ